MRRRSRIAGARLRRSSYFLTNECCVGFYCSGLSCSQCKETGQTPGNVPLTSDPDRKSCCSKAIDSVTLKCK